MLLLHLGHDVESIEIGVAAAGRASAGLTDEAGGRSEIDNCWILGGRQIWRPSTNDSHKSLPPESPGRRFHRLARRSMARSGDFELITAAVVDVVQPR